MSLLRSSMRCAMRSRGVVPCPGEPSCSAGGSLLGRIVSLSECTRCPGRVEMPRPGLLPGTGGFVRSPRTPFRKAAPSPGASLSGRRSPGPTAPEATSAPARCTGGEVPAARISHPSRGLGHRGGPRRPPARWGAAPMLPQAPRPPLVRPLHQRGPNIKVGQPRARGTFEGRGGEHG